MRLVQSAKEDVVILVDVCAVRHDAQAEVNELVVKTGFPVYAAPMGKTAVSENYERYGGVSLFFSSCLPVASVKHGGRSTLDPSVIRS